MAAEVLDVARAPTIEDAREAAALAAAADQRVEQVFAFGSVARGEAGKRSDIDLLVLLGEVSPQEWSEVDRRIAKAVRSGADWPVDLIVQPRADFEHLSQNVTASFEHLAAGEAVILYQSSPVLPSGGRPTDGMPRDNLALAADQVGSANRYLFSLLDAIESIPTSEKRANVVSSSGGMPIEKVRRNRYLVLLESAHMVIEQSFRSAASASEGLSLGGGHEIDNFIEIMGDTPERTALEAAVVPIREGDGKLRCWRLGSYTGHLSEWSAEATAENASAHIGAAMACAEAAVAAIERRAAGDDSLLAGISEERSVIRLLGDAPSTPDGIKTGRLAAPRRRFRRLFDNKRREHGERLSQPGAEPQQAAALHARLSPSQLEGGYQRGGYPTDSGAPCMNPKPGRGQRCAAGHPG